VFEKIKLLNHKKEIKQEYSRETEPITLIYMCACAYIYIYIYSLQCHALTKKAGRGARRCHGDHYTFSVHQPDSITQQHRRLAVIQSALLKQCRSKRNLTELNEKQKGVLLVVADDCSGPTRSDVQREGRGRGSKGLCSTLAV